jgi:hypothetical protein
MRINFKGRGRFQSMSKISGRNRASRVLLIWLLLITCLLPPSVLSAGPAATEEDAVQTAFLYNFMKFVEWPPEVFDDPESPIIVCTLGESPFINTVQSLEGKRTRQRPLVIKRYDSYKTAKRCHVLVVSDFAGKDSYPAILSRLKGTSVLTVGNIEGFAEQGGMIEMFSVENKIRFNINLGSAKQSSLKISSQLLKLARKVIE